MTKSEVIDLLARKQSHLSSKDVEWAVKIILEKMSDALATGNRIEVRGFGSFSLHHRGRRKGRNPKTGEKVNTPEKKTIHFKMAKEMFKKINNEKE